MTLKEQAAIRNLIERLSEPHCGGAAPHNPAVALPHGFKPAVAPAPLPEGFEAVSRQYLNTWIIPSLRLLLPGPGRNPKLACELARR